MENVCVYSNCNLCIILFSRMRERADKDDRKKWEEYRERGSRGSSQTSSRIPPLFSDSRDLRIVSNYNENERWNSRDR